MLALHLCGRPIEDEIDMTRIAQSLEGYSASDLKFLVDEAARDALRLELPVSEHLIAEAKRRVPPSVTKQDEKRYQSFRTRGI